MTTDRADRPRIDADDIRLCRSVSILTSTEPVGEHVKTRLGAVVVALVVLWPAMAGAGTSSMGGAKQRAADTAYSWWTSPTMARTSSSLYFTGVTSGGYQRVYRWSRNSKKKLVLTYANLHRRAADDHNAPALSLAPGKPSLVVYTGHPGVMYYRRATNPNPTLKTTRSSFGPAVRMPFTSKTTYAQVLRDGDRVIVLTRYMGDDLSGWYYVTSSNSGATWSEPRELFDSERHQAYLLARPTAADPLAFHVMAYWHPRYGPDNVVGYRRITFEQLWSGAVERFTVGGMERIWASDPAGPAGQEVRLLDGGDKRGRPMVFISTWDAANRVPLYRQLVRDESGAWSSQVLRSAGATLAPGAGNYAPGVTLDSRPSVNRVYLGYRGAWDWKLASAEIDATGRVGAPRVLASSRRPLARPVSAGSDLMFQRLDRYTSYKSYKISVHTLTTR